MFSLVRRSRRLVTFVAVVATLSGSSALTSRDTAEAATYVVIAGQTLSEVATTLGVRLGDLAAANGIVDVHRVRAGDRLTVPDKPGAAAAAPAAPVPSAPAGELPAQLRARPERLALMPLFDAAAARFKVPADLFKAMTWLESGWQNEKVSSTKALGIGQLMPDTVTFVNKNLLRANLDPRRPEDNITMSARFLSYLLSRTGNDVPTALAAYYQGLGSVQRNGPGGPTRRYVADVLAVRRKF